MQMYLFANNLEYYDVGFIKKHHLCGNYLGTNLFYVIKQYKLCVFYPMPEDILSMHMLFSCFFSFLLLFSLAKKEVPKTSFGIKLLHLFSNHIIFDAFLTI